MRVPGSPEAFDLVPADLPSASRRVLLHGDFNPGNVLSWGDGRWAVIDPKPMIGDPAYDPWPLVGFAPRDEAA
jgi:streptomycin 6-kinase